MVLRIRHRGLRKLYEDGGTRGVNASHVAKLRLILAALDAAEAPADMDVAGWRLHRPKGAGKGYWSVWVSRKTLSQILNGRGSITTEMAIRLERGIGSSAAAWLRMQMAYDLARVQQSAKRIKVKRLAKAS